jgi:hypothetical protein
MGVDSLYRFGRLDWPAGGSRYPEQSAEFGRCALEAKGQLDEELRAARSAQRNVLTPRLVGGFLDPFMSAITRLLPPGANYFGMNPPFIDVPLDAPLRFPDGKYRAKVVWQPRNSKFSGANPPSDSEKPRRDDKTWAYLDGLVGCAVDAESLLRLGEGLSKATPCLITEVEMEWGQRNRRSVEGACAQFARNHETQLDAEGTRWRYMNWNNEPIVCIFPEGDPATFNALGRELEATLEAANLPVKVLVSMTDEQHAEVMQRIDPLARAALKEAGDGWFDVPASEPVLERLNRNAVILKLPRINPALAGTALPAFLAAETKLIESARAAGLGDLVHPYAINAAEMHMGREYIQIVLALQNIPPPPGVSEK